MLTFILYRFQSEINTSENVGTYYPYFVWGAPNTEASGIFLVGVLCVIGLLSKSSQHFLLLYAGGEG